MKSLAILFALLPLTMVSVDPIAPPPLASPTGVISIWGNAQMEPLARRWVEAFGKRHPKLRIALHMTGSDVAMAGLYTGQADIALLGRQATDPEVQALEWVYGFRPSAFEIMTGSIGAPGKSPALAIFVHWTNPLTHISMEQLRGVFGEEEGSSIRTWGDLGLGNKWRSRPINLYGPDAESGTGRFFRDAALGGSDRMAWKHLTEFTEPVVKGPYVDKGGQEALAVLARDPAGIALSNVNAVPSGVKLLAVSSSGSEAVLPTEQNVISRRYPLSRPVYAYVKRPPNDALDDETALFLAFILSPDGQGLVASTSDYLPLQPEIAGRELAKLGPG